MQVTLIGIIDKKVPWFSIFQQLVFVEGILKSFPRLEWAQSIHKLEKSYVRLTKSYIGLYI